MPRSIEATLLAFRDELNAVASPATFRSYFTSVREPCCLEHGPTGHPELPFLGKPFVGHDEILKYYGLIGSVLKGKGSDFAESDVVLKKLSDREAKVIWTGSAVWCVAKTGKERQEAVVWLFEMEVEEGEWKIARWEVWADPLSAYLASRP